VAFILYVGVVLPPIDRLIHFTEQLQQGMAAFERFVEVMDIQSDIKDLPDAVDLAVSEGSVTLERVSFSYGSSSDTVLRGIDLHLRGGSTVAIVGESGAGKSTLVSLIPRFYEPTEGRILIDGQDIAHVRKISLRKQIGFVQHNVFLFDGTIRENLRYGRSDATDEQMHDSVWTRRTFGTSSRSLPDVSIPR
jgi:ATP-binding cassette subfamily B protein